MSAVKKLGRKEVPQHAPPATQAEAQAVRDGEADADSNTTAPSPATTAPFAFVPDGKRVPTRDESLAPVVPPFEPTRTNSQPPKDYEEKEVVALRMGYYNERRIREGEVFTIAIAGNGFLPSWVALANAEDKDPVVSRSRHVVANSTGQEIRDDVARDAGTKLPTYLGGNQRRPQ